MTTIEPNKLYERKNELQKKYLNQLDKVIQEYPNYKANLPNDYDKQLSILNGILKKTSALQSDADEKIRLFERTIRVSDTEIQKYKKNIANLEKYTSFKDLDATSKRMLSDSIEEYNDNRLFFWIKFSIILIIVATCIKDDEVKQLGLIFVVTIVISLIYIAYTSKG